MADAYIGEVRLFCGNYAPEDWLFCWGQELNVMQYQALYSLIGNTYGGTVSKTFKLPDLRGCAFEIEGERRTGFGAEHDVFRHGHRLDQHEVLVDHADAERNRVMRRFYVANLAVDDDLAAVGGVEAVSDAHRSGLACTILPHDGMDRSRLDDDVDVIVSQHIAEAFCYFAEFQHSEVF